MAFGPSYPTRGGGQARTLRKHGRDWCKRAGISEKTGKPLKSYNAELHTLNHLITDEDWQLIDGCLSVIADSIQLWQARPEYRHILAQDNRLRQAAAPILFKD